MIDVHMLRVFTDVDGKFGDVASVVIDEGKHISDDERQAMASKLNTGETIFINDVTTANISVMHPQGEIDFAGVGVLGAAYLLARLRGKPTDSMQARGGVIKVWQDGELTWAQANLSTMPPWNFKQLESAAAVECMTIEETKTLEHTMFWAWMNEANGLIRARTFASDWEIPEAQGNGSGSMVLAAKLGRQLEIHHGEGSLIFAKPEDDDRADIGGRVVESESTARDLPPSK